MPELPEVETMCRGLAGIVGRRIAGAEFPRGPVRPLVVNPPPGPLARWLTGAEIASVGRRGKRVVLEILAGASRAVRRWLVIEPRMTGLMLIVDPPSVEHVRMVIDLEEAASNGARRPPAFLRRHMAAAVAVVIASLALPAGLIMLGGAGNPVATVVKVIGDHRLRSGQSVGTLPHDLAAGTV